MDLKRGQTGLVYDTRMTEHRCLWNDDYPECPERFTKILERCNELKLIDRCLLIPSRPATVNEILLKHTQEHYDILKATDGDTNEQRLEHMCTHYDVFIHPSTFELSLLAVGCAIELVDKILLGEVQNGMAIIRPPGHHAMETRFDGFCFFNNVAIAAQHAINNHSVKRILVVDFDVHHGQGTQQLFYDDPRVLYFSVHRFDHGTYFPRLRESDFDYVGEGRGKGFNFNVALNESGMTNADYLAIWQQILLPVAVEFQPELVLVSAGYDAAYGCPLGEMELSPACYAHLITPLMTLAEGKIAAFLEGGYNLDSLAESAAITLRTFLGDACPLLEMLDEPSESVQESILNCTQSHKEFWKCLRFHKEYRPEALNREHIPSDFHQVIQKFIANEEMNGDYYDTRHVFPNQTRSKDVEAKVSEHLQYLKSVTKLDKPLNRVCFVASSEKINEFLERYDLLDRLHPLEISSSESSKHSLVLELLNNVLHGKYQSGICFEIGEAAGASHDLHKAATFATEFQGLKRVLIVDFDKGHFKDIGTQKNWKRKVLHMSLDHDVPPKSIGNGEKFTINIPINKETVNNFDYVATFQRVIMPIAYEFNPELVLVSADFDAISDPIRAGNVSWELFGYLTQWLSALANGKIILFMKGDYNATATCVKALLGDPLPMLKSRMEASINREAIQNVISVQHKYWKSLKFNKLLPELNVIRGEINE